LIDVGVVAPTDSEGFFEERGFGEDAEGSVVFDEPVARQRRRCWERRAATEHP
jgi:hypothetical protein